MTLKTGDRVRVLDASHACGLAQLGDLGTINRGPDKDGHFLVKLDIQRSYDRYAYFSPERLELVGTPFKAGDRVHCTNLLRCDGGNRNSGQDGYPTIGKVYTVLSAAGSGEEALVRINAFHSTWSASQFELVAQAPENTEDTGFHILYPFARSYGRGNTIEGLSLWPRHFTKAWVDEFPLARPIPLPPHVAAAKPGDDITVTITGKVRESELADCVGITDAQGVKFDFDGEDLQAAVVKVKPRAFQVGDKVICTWRGGPAGRSRATILALDGDVAWAKKDDGSHSSTKTRYLRFDTGL
jgi:hypothetical protein